MDYPNVVITFLIEYQGKFLLVARGSGETNFADLWAFPGGKVEIGETAIDTIRREVLEETGLSLTDDICFLDSYSFKQTMGLAFLVRATHDTVSLGDSLEGYAWVGSTDDMQAYRCIPGIYNHLERALEMLQKNCFDSAEAANLIPPKYKNAA